MSHPERSSPISRRRNLVFWAPTLLILSAFCAVLTIIVLQAKASAYEKAGRAETSLANTLKSDLALNIETIDLSLQAVADNLQYPGVAELNKDLRQLVLFDRSATARDLDGILVLDERGEVWIDSRSIDPQPHNDADRDYFQAALHGHEGLFIGRPITGRHDGQFIGLSRRMSRPDGSFAGVVVAKLRLSYFETLFANATLGDGGNITLASTDGTLIMRWPYKADLIGRNFRSSKLYERLPTAPSGLLEYNTEIDGNPRLLAYAKVGNLPLVIGVGQSTAVVYANWRKMAIAVGLVAFALCALSMVLALITMREFNKRERAETRLAQLATHDGLTQLRNRYYFDSAIAIEASKDNALCCLMIDADHFKALNDRHGHKAGDVALQTIARCIAELTRKEVDIAARYGGEEFIVLLRNTSIAEAVTVAERIRRRIIAEAAHSASPLPTISIGVAARASHSDTDVSEMLKRADAALYVAKRSGRNRVAVDGAYRPAHDELNLAS